MILARQDCKASGTPLDFPGSHFFAHAEDDVVAGAVGESYVGDQTASGVLDGAHARLVRHEEPGNEDQRRGIACVVVGDAADAEQRCDFDDIVSVSGVSRRTSRG